jgi:hypothetical protein
VVERAAGAEHEQPRALAPLRRVLRDQTCRQVVVVGRDVARR